MHGLISKALTYGGSGNVSPNIQSITITENGKYEAPESIDGYNPVLVNVPDKYDEGYEDGFRFASEYFESIVDANKKYYLCIYLIDASDISFIGQKYPGAVRYVSNIYDVADLNTPLAHFEDWVGGHPKKSMDAKIVNIKWGYGLPSQIQLDAVKFTTISNYNNGVSIQEIKETLAIYWHGQLRPYNTTVGRSEPTI